jgi:predicted YcjX-like family ATPase
MSKTPVTLLMRHSGISLMREKCKHFKTLVLEQREFFCERFSIYKCTLEELAFSDEHIIWKKKMRTGSEEWQTISYEAFEKWVGEAIRNKMVQRLIAENANKQSASIGDENFEILFLESKDLPLVDEDYGQFSGVVRMTYEGPTHLYDHLYFGNKEKYEIPDEICKKPKK